MVEKTEPWQAAHPKKEDLHKSEFGSALRLPRKPFNLILLGIFFALVNFNINNIPLLPNGVGYLLLAFGTGALAEYSSKFATTKILSFTLLAIWVIGFFVNGYGAASSLVVCLLVWHLLGGLREIAIRGHRPDLAKLAEARRLVFVIIYGGLALVVRMPNIHGGGIAILAVVAMIAIFVLTILIIYLIFRMKNVFAPKNF